MHFVVGLCVRVDGFQDTVVRKFHQRGDGLVAQFGKPKNKIVADIRKLIEKRYLAGYAFDGETLVYAEKKERRKERIYVGKCPSCNAIMEYADGKVSCPYCGFVSEATVDEIKRSE